MATWGSINSILCWNFLIGSPVFNHLNWWSGFSDSSIGKEPACNVGDPSSVPRLGRSAGKGIGYPVQYSWASLVAQLVKKNPPAMWETWVRSLGWEDALERERLPTPVLWPGEFHGLYNPWGRKESNTTEQLSLSQTGDQSLAKIVPKPLELGCTPFIDRSLVLPPSPSKQAPF